MDSLPDELLSYILNFSKPKSWIDLQRINRRFRGLVLSHQETIQSLNILSDYFWDYPHFDIHFVDIRLEKFAAFLCFQFPNLKHLGLSGCPIYISWPSLITFGQFLPNLESLDLSRKNNQPTLTFNSLLALPCFQNLKVLGLTGILPRVGTHKHYLIKTPPLHLLSNLNHISLDRSRLLFGLLRQLKSQNNNLNQLESLRISSSVKFLLSDSDLELLLWFFGTHQHLVEVELSALKLECPNLSWELLSRIFSMSKLKSLTLSDCECLHDTYHDMEIPENLFIFSFELQILNLVNSNLCSENLVNELIKHCPYMAVGRKRSCDMGII